MNLMVQPPDYYLLMAMQQPSPRHHHRPGRSKGPSLRGRLRDLMTRTTLGPRLGDHVVGESQWSQRATLR
ncbi:MAG: hypothetical protein U0667_04590 [Chloroflexota bacterium]